MRLIRHAIRPTWTPFMDFSLKGVMHEEWRPFFSLVDFSYWNVELTSE
jgi:hypothetical protein